jgi:ribosome maturation factor RimP
VEVSATIERVTSLVAPIATELGLDIYDVEFAGGALRVLLQQPGGSVGLEEIAEATRRISRALDDADPIGGSYTLEVSSPGLERTLRTPEHFRGALGEPVTVKTRPGTEGDRRVDGVLSAVESSSVTVTLPDGTTRTVALADVQKARTRFEWGPAPKPGGRRSASTTDDPPADAAPGDPDSEAIR